jgi:hypothetical protein
MTLNFKRVLGWVLVFVGLIIVFWDISASYYYFTAKQEFPQVFVLTAVEKKDTPSAGVFDPEALAGQIIQEQIGQLIPANTISLLLNMSAWILFATFLVYAGAKVVGLGAGFLKE